jgi:proteasome-associated ATPase
MDGSLTIRPKNEQMQTSQPDTLQRILSDAMSPSEERAAIEEYLRGQPNLAQPLLFAVLAQKHRLRVRLDETTKTLLAPPWHSAEFLCLSGDGARALVATGNRRLSVTISDDVDRGALGCGQSVFLNSAQNVLLQVSPGERRSGAVGEFSRFHGGTQGVIRGPLDEEVVVDLGVSLLETGIESGDLLLYDRESRVAYGKVDKRESPVDLLEELPLNVRIAELGGLDAIFRELTSEVTLHLQHPELVRRYGLKATRGILLCGPPGTGKTSLVQALGLHLRSTLGIDIKAFLVRPGVHRSMWFGASEQRIRDLFAAAKRAAAGSDRYVLLFFDDMDHLGSRDHRLAGEVDARLLPSFLQEIDGVTTHRMMLVGATNREDLLDEALLRPGRFGKLFRFTRPTRQQAREILLRHLTADVPVQHNGDGQVEAIRALTENVLATLYAPNGELSTLATLTFRDGSRRPLTSAQIMSGALIAAAVEQAKRRSCLRVLNGGPEGIRSEDLHAALDRELSGICARLKPGPSLQQMLDLPPDRDVVRIELRRSDGSLPSSDSFNVSER